MVQSYSKEFLLAKRDLGLPEKRQQNFRIGPIKLSQEIGGKQNQNQDEAAEPEDRNERYYL